MKLLITIYLTGLTKHKKRCILYLSNWPKAFFKLSIMNLVKKLKDYLVDAIQEMKKIVWPNKKQVKVYTILVIAMSIGVAIFFALLDYIFNLGLGKLIK